MKSIPTLILYNSVFHEIINCENVNDIEKLNSDINKYNKSDIIF